MELSRKPPVSRPLRRGALTRTGGGSSRRARSRPSGRCALPVVLAAPSGGARLALWAARRSPPGFKAVGSPPPGAAGRRFCGSAGGFRAVAVLRPLARCRPRPRSPGAPSLAASPRPWRAAARLCSPSAFLRLAAGCAAPCPLRSPSGRCGLPPVALRSCRASSGAAGAPAVSPLPPGGCCSLAASVAPPPAGALAPLRGARGAAFRAPAGWGFGALRRAALLRRAGSLPASSSQENAGRYLTPCKIRAKIVVR